MNNSYFASRGALKVALAACFVTFTFAANPASAQTFRDIHDFGGQVQNLTGAYVQDGWQPMSPILLDAAGNVYGTTTLGTGSGGSGSWTIWEITAAGTYIQLYNSAGSKSSIVVSDPQGSLAMDSAGNLYGTARSGGQYATIGNPSCGAIWKLNPITGAFQILHNFGGVVTNADGSQGPDGEQPYGVIIDASGNLYGSAPAGGPFVNGNTSGDGMLWKLSPTGVYTDLHDFPAGADGWGPGCPVLDSAGNLYGASNSYSSGGSNLGAGNLWKMSPGGTFTILHVFGGTVTNANGRGGGRTEPFPAHSRLT